MHLTRFIGRTADLFRVDELMRQGQQLVTLWGPAGMGKTRLAHAFAERRRAARGRVAWCELGAAGGEPDVWAAVAGALQLPSPRAAADVGRSIANAGRLLVVLDNADAVTAATAAAVRAWSAQAPEAQFLVTSRERLGAAGELTYELLPMIEAEAVALFDDRARLVRPDFHTSLANRALIEELVDRLERTPLAIELAAARIDVLGLDGLLRRLGDRLDVLGVRGAIAWSWELLAPPERAALAQSSVFVDGFTLDAAEAVIRADGGGSVLDLLHALRNKSLLRSVPIADGVRFGHYHSVRAFAAEKLDDEAAARDRHAAHYLAQAGDLSRDAANVQAVLARALELGRADDALRAALLLDGVLAARGPVDTHVGTLDAALAVAGGAEPLRLAVQRARGTARRMRGDLDGAEADLRAVAAAAGGGLRAAACADLGVVFHQRRELTEAAAWYERAHDAARAAGDRAVEARALGNLAAVDHDRGAFDAAEGRYRRALAIFADLGERRHEGVFLANLAVLEQELDRFDDARTHFRAALVILDGVGDQRLIGVTRANLAALEHERGNLEEARSGYRAALEVLERVGELRSEALCRGRLAAVLATLGDVDGARGELDRAERELERVGDTVGFDAVQLARAFIAMTEANRERAGGHVDRAAALLQEVAQRIARARGGEPSLVELSDDARALVRVLERALDQLDGESPADALLVGPEARWFRGPGGDWHDLSKRKPLRLILLSLTEMRRRAPGAGVAVDALQAAGWPGEKMTAAAGSNRVYVTLNKLRKLGLEGVLVRDDTGYLLDPAVPVERVSADWRALRDAGGARDKTQ